MNNQIFTYYAFISYKREDEKWAKWLQKKLESYGFPVALRKDNPSLPQKIRPIFRDQSDLSGGNLKEEIEKGLAESKYLIVICSPRSAKSPWVSKEVRYFIDCGRENYIIPFIIGGSPNASNPEDECFPEGLRLLSGEREILGININEMGRDAAAIKVIARMFNLRFDTLWQRHEREKKRKRFAVIASTLLFAILGFAISAYMVYLNTRIVAERDRAEMQTKIAHQERNRANLERDRANEERDNAIKANRNLAQAKDSIQLQSNLLVRINKDLEETNFRLAEERDNVKKASINIQKEQIRLIAEKAEGMYSEGNLLPALRLITTWLPSSEHPNIPYVPEAMNILYKIMSNLSQSCYKAIDRSWNDVYDTVEFSNDGHWVAFTENGFFYIYNYRNQELHNLPGTDRTEYNCTFQYTNDNTTLYGGGLSKWFSWDLTSYRSKSDNLVDSINHMVAGENWDYNGFCSFRFPNTYINKNIITSYCWENGDSIIFQEDKEKPDQYQEIFYYKYKQSNGSESIKKLSKAFTLGRDFVVNPSIPELCYLENNYICIYNLKEDELYTIPIQTQSYYDNICYYLQTGKEIMVNKNLYSNRTCNNLSPLVISNLEELQSYQSIFCKDSIRYFGKELYLCDTNAQIGVKLYLLDNNEDDGYPDLYLFDKDNTLPKIFTPYIPFSTGNGNSYFQNAFILNNNEILCVSGQGQHIIYNIKNDNRYKFENSKLNTTEYFAHPDIHIMKSIISNNKEFLYTISCGGILSIFDIKTRKLIYEFAIPKLFINSSNNTEIDFDMYAFSVSNEERIIDFIIENDNIIKIVYELNDNYYSYNIKLPSIANIVDHAIQQLNTFWD
ncbi:MAG: TIR domain-containing protein [Candidatus Limisoma sp.]